LDNAYIKEFDVAWRKAVRRVLKKPADTHSRLLPLLIKMLPFTDDIHKCSAAFITDLFTACLKSDSTLVRSVAKFGILIGRCDSFLGRNTLLCCSHFGWQFADFAHGNVDLSNGTLLRKHHELVNSLRLAHDAVSIRDH